jgi:hypothetical protein
MWETNQRAPLEFEILCPVAISSSSYLGGNPHTLIVHIPSNLQTVSISNTQLGDTY